MPSRIRFRISTGPNTRWSCPISCGTCTFVRPNGATCLNKVCYGSPLCWIHNIRTYGVRARPSTIAGAGKGLFTTRTFQAGDWICPMICEDITPECLEDRYPGDLTAPYADMDSAHPDHVTDCACSRGIASQANALFRADGLVRHIRFHNAVSTYRNEVGFHVGIWIQARRAIQEGNEIFLWYGPNNTPDSYRLEDTHTTRRYHKTPTKTAAAPC